MTPEKRTIKNEARKQKAINHRIKRNNKYFDRITQAKELGCPLYSIGKYGAEHWKDDNSPTGFSQKCSYQGICEFPCNGDC